MSQKCFPILYVNLAGEMLYILDQRLKVVISDEESKRGPRVVKDLVRNIFLKERLEGIWRPGGIPGKKEMRLLFDKLAHCSVMKLTSNSMNKLFDLMVMHCKYEFLMIDYPQQLLTVTMNHLAGIRDLCKDQPESIQIIDQTHAMIYTLYRATPLWEWVQIRNTLLQFFMHANVKVSLMIRSGRQSEDGHFILRAPGEKVKITMEQIAPGKTSYFEAGALTNTTEWPSQRQYTYLDNAKENFNIDTNEPRSTTLGGNMYLGAGRDSLKVKGSGGVAEGDHLPPGNEVKLFEQIFGNFAPAPGSPPPSYDSIMDVNMFDDDKEEKKYEKDLKILRIDAAKGKKSLNTAVAEMKLGEDKPKKTKASKGVDMLDLMDEAAARPATAKKSIGGSVRSRPPSKSPSRPPSQGPAGRERSASTKAARTPSAAGRTPSAAGRTPSASGRTAAGAKPPSRAASRTNSASRK